METAQEARGGYSRRAVDVKSGLRMRADIWGSPDNHRSSWQANAADAPVCGSVKGGIMNGISGLVGVATYQGGDCGRRSGELGLNEFTSCSELIIHRGTLLTVDLLHHLVVNTVVRGGQKMGK